MLESTTLRLHLFYFIISIILYVLTPSHYSGMFIKLGMGYIAVWFLWGVYLTARSDKVVEDSRTYHDYNTNQIVTERDYRVRTQEENERDEYAHLNFGGHLTLIWSVVYAIFLYSTFSGTPIANFGGEELMMAMYCMFITLPLLLVAKKLAANNDAPAPARVFAGLLCHLPSYYVIIGFVCTIITYKLLPNLLGSELFWHLEIWAYQYLGIRF